MIVALGVLLAWRCLQCIVGRLQQAVVEGAPFRRQRHAALFDLAEARGMVAGDGVAVVLNEIDAFFQRLEAGLAQQDCTAAAWRALDDRFGRNAAAGHRLLNAIDIQRARRQVVDMRPFKRHDVGDQAMLIVQLPVFFGADRRLIVPAEGFQRLFDKFLRLRCIQSALRFLQRDQFQRAIGKDAAACQQALGQLTQSGIFYQFQAHQGGEHAERTDLQRVFMYGAKSGGVHRNARYRQVIVTDRRHAHHPEQAAQGGQLVCGADPDRAVALHR